VRSPLSRSLTVLALVATLVLGACGGDDQASGSDETAAPTTSTTEATDTTEKPDDHGPDATKPDGMNTTEFTIVGKNIAFSPDKLTIPVGKEVTIIFDNRDNAVPHNIHFKTPQAVKSELTEGKTSGVKDRLKLKVDEAGTYDFLCDVHPTMKGELTAA
jgi:plastocyanin